MLSKPQNSRSLLW